MVCVWAPQYFRSKWCVAEFDAMLARQDALAPGARPIIYPIVYQDGDCFPAEARALTYGYKLESRHRHPEPAFRTTQSWFALSERVQTMAVELAKMIGSAPPWQASWPSLETPLKTTATTGAPRPRFGDA